MSVQSTIAHESHRDDNVKENVQNIDIYENMLDACQKILKKEGFAGLFKGLMPSLILVSNPVIQFVIYEQATKFTQKRNQGVNLSSLQFFFIGALAKAVATIVTYPYQVIKSREQASTATITMSTRIFHMLQTEGVSAFWQGLFAKLTQTVSNAAFMFLFYERIFQQLRAAFIYLKNKQIAK
jgi:adenine nucleotide transporter 17